MITLRDATKEDYDFLYRLMEATMKEYYIAAYGSWDEEVEHNFFDESFNEMQYRIIICDGQDVGCLVTVNDESELFVHEIQILPQHQNRGIGKLIMETLIDDSEKTQVPIGLEVLKVNSLAEAFYRRLGFMHVGETTTHKLMRREPRII